MTTIAADRHTIACDSAIDPGDGTSFRVTTKLHEIPGGWAGYAGTVSVAVELIKWLRSGKRRKKKEFARKDEASVLIAKRSGLWLLDQEYLLLELAEPYFAIGSGSVAARAAFMAGADAASAVEIAIALDPKSDGPVTSVAL